MRTVKSVAKRIAFSAPTLHETTANENLMHRRWNCYPGARVDSPVPIYQLSIPEVYNTWSFTTNYPDWRELQAYFDHVDKVCDLSKDTAFETVVTSAEFDEQAGKWTVKTADGRTAKTRFLIIAAGFAAKLYIPDYKGIDKFKGVIHHSSFWPPEDVDVKGKRVAVIGTGMCTPGSTAFHPEAIPTQILLFSNILTKI
jgi:cation diffusion facilitator CzcD-associated flavoprotein CzcO